MYAIERETQRLILEAGTGDDDTPEELEYWTVGDFEDVLPSPEPIAAADY